MSLSTFIDHCSKDPTYFHRRLFWEVLHSLPERDVSAKTKHGKLLFSSKDLHMGRALYCAKECDYSDIEAAARLLKKTGRIGTSGGKIVLDVGANIGTVCIPFVKNGHFQSAIGFEPGPKNYEYLGKNIRANGLEGKIKAHSMALSSVNGTKPLLICAENFGDHRIAIESEEKTLFSFEPKREQVSVSVKTLDQFLLDEKIPHQSIDLLWMDTQGHEPEVLKGALGLLKSGVSLVTEIWPYSLKRSEPVLKEFFDTLKSNYKYFYDLKISDPVQRSTAELDSLLEIYNGDQYACTNILLVS